MSVHQAPRDWLDGWAAAVRPALAGATLAGTVYGVAVVVQAFLIAAIVHGVVIGEMPLAAFHGHALALVLAVTVRALARWLQLTMASEASLRVRRAVRERMLDHIARLGPQRLGDTHTAGLVSRVVDQVEALDGYFARYRPQTRLVVIVPSLILLAVVSQDWLAALFLVLAAPLIPLFMALVGTGAERLQRTHFAVLTRLSGHFLDRIRGLPTLQLFGYAPRSIEDVAAAADDYRRRSMATLRVAFLSSAVLEFFASVAIAVVAIYVGFGLLGYIEFGPADSLTLFSGLFVLLLAPEFFQPLRSLAQHYHDRAAAIGAASEILALLRLSPPAPTASASSALAPGAVCLDRVTLGYPQRGNIVGPLSLSVAPGECVVLVGCSGSGKSSLLRAIAGLQDVAAGALQVGPGGLAWMGQKPFLMHGTIAENIRLGRPDADADAVAAAAAQARVEAFARLLPEGLESPVGERGARLSGGQAQRVALARVIVSKAALALLDEPTAGLDGESEAAVLAGLKALAGSGRTLVIASHHPAVRATADRVVDLDAALPADGGGDA